MEQARQIQALNQQASQLQAEKNELISQAKKVRREANIQKAKKGVQGIWRKLTLKAKELQKSLPSGPVEAVAKMQNAGRTAIANGKNLINKNVAKVADSGIKAALI
jgi:restriction endonuclease S subunit